MVRTTALILLFAAATASAQAVDDVPPLTAETKAIVQASIKDRLIDGDSAKWRWLPAKKGEAGIVQYCGFFNAKNRMGGYTGFNPVWVTGRWKSGAFSPVAAEFAKGPYLDGLAARNCAAAGYSLAAIPPE